MRSPAFGLACLFGAACLLPCISCASDVVTPPEAANTQDVAEVTETEDEGVEVVPKPQMEDPIPIPGGRRRQRASSRKEKLGAESGAALTDDTVAKMFDFAQAYPLKQRPGVKTALVGLIGFTVFMLIHVLVQSRKHAPILDDMFFKDEDSRVTFTGAASIISMTLLIAGCVELYTSAHAKGTPLSLLTWPSHAKENLELGIAMVKYAAIALVAGWLLGLPFGIMELSTVFLLGGITFTGLGAAQLTRDVRDGMKLTKQIYSLGVDDVTPMEQGATIEPHVMANVLEHFLRHGSEEEALLKSPKLLNTLTGIVNSILAKAETPEGSAELGALVEGMKNSMNATPELFTSDTLNAVAEQLKQLQVDQEDAAPVLPAAPAAETNDKAAEESASKENEETKGDSEKETENQKIEEESKQDQEEQQQQQQEKAGMN